MGARFTTFQNKSEMEMEIRVFVPPARPDHYRTIIRIAPGETKRVKNTTLCCDYVGWENPSFLMIFTGGTYSGVCIMAHQVVKYTKIFGYVDENGLLVFRGTRFAFPSLCNLKFPSLYMYVCTSVLLCICKHAPSYVYCDFCSCLRLIVYNQWSY